MSARKQHVQWFYNTLDAQHLESVDTFYSPDAEFSDPIVTLKGRDRIKAYYAGLYQNVESIAFDFPSIIEEGDSCVAIWVMHLRAPKLRAHEPVVLHGTSHLIFTPSTNLVRQHRDYFDMGAFVYEHVPILGPAIRYIKGRLHSD